MQAHCKTLQFIGNVTAARFGIIIVLELFCLFFITSLGCSTQEQNNKQSNTKNVTQNTFERVDFPSSDGLLVTADLYETGDKSDPLMFLFHQSISSRHEFRDIAQRLTTMGINALAVDLRWGANHEWFPGENETALRYGTAEILRELRDGNDERAWPTVLLSYEDMLAAYDWTIEQGFSGKKYALGASMGSILMLRLPADRRLEVVFAYSPGEYGDDSTQVREWIASHNTPVYIAARASEAEISKLIFDSAKNPRKQYYQTTQDRHGSSILTRDTAAWTQFTEFLGIFHNPEE